ncbi:MAG TPA: DUF4383 domain-containing protein [Candidatus Thermoplasmatota archaeon]|nr:DUF4383 domain-containing protein [Candidatus Thermoplasmatota archaeon]
MVSPVANLNKTIGLVFGVVFLAVGLLGFVMHPTLILFGVNALHNVVHLASGAVLLAGALMGGGKNARQVNLVFGAVYLLVAALGFIAPALTDALVASGSDAFPFADAILHAILGIALVGAGLAFKDDSPRGVPSR